MGINFQCLPDTLLNTLHNYSNLILWTAGHVHRNTITPQPATTDPTSPEYEYGFWEVETPSLRDFPQQFRRFEIALNAEITISIFTYDVDVAANPDSFSGTGPRHPRLRRARTGWGHADIPNTGAAGTRHGPRLGCLQCRACNKNEPAE